MKTLLTLALSLWTLAVFAQEREVIDDKSTEHNVTISSMGMYDGTESDSARFWFDKGETEDRKHNFAEARDNYLKAIAHDSTYVEAYDNVGLAYRRMGEVKKAIEFYKKSVVLYPKGIMAHQNLAVAYGLLNNYDGAIEEYKTIAILEPENPESFFGLANSYMVKQEYDKALPNAEKALKLYEQTNSHHIADGYYLIGLIYYYSGDKKKAKKQLKIAKEKGANIHPQIENELF